MQYLQKLNFEVVASGDSYNDLGMLKTADRCILFNPPSSLVAEYPDMAVAGIILSYCPSSITRQHDHPYFWYESQIQHVHRHGSLSIGNL